MMVRPKRLLGILNFRFINAFRNGVLASFAGIYLRENLSLSVTESNLLFTLLEFIGAMGQFLIWGWVADKYKARTSLIIGAETVTGLGYIGTFYVHRYFLSASDPHAAGLSIVFSIGFLEVAWGAGFVGFFALLGDIPDPKERAKYMGYAVSMTSTGRICGSILGGIFFDYKYRGGGFGEGVLFYALSSIILGFALMAWLTRKDTEIDYRKDDEHATFSSDEQTSEKSRSSSQHPKEGTTQSQRLFYWFLAGIIIFSLGRGSVDQIVLFYLRLSPPASIGASSFAVSLFMTAHWIGYLTFGPVAGQLSGRTVTIGYLAALVWFVALPLFYFLVESIPMALLLFASRGIAMSIFIVTSFSIAVKLIPAEKRGRLLGQYNASSMMAWGLGGSVIGGPLADWRLSQGASLSQAYTFTFFAAALLGLSAIVLTLWKVKDALKNPEEAH